MLDKEGKMIYTKDGLTRDQFIKLLQYSLEADCQQIMAVKPETIIVNDHSFQSESVIRFLEVKEKTFKTINAKGKDSFSTRFFVKILVEDNYFEETPDHSYHKSGVVLPRVHANVCKILSN